MKTTDLVMIMFRTGNLHDVIFLFFNSTSFRIANIEFLLIKVENAGIMIEIGKENEL